MSLDYHEPLWSTLGHLPLMMNTIGLLVSTLGYCSSEEYSWWFQTFFPSIRYWLVDLRIFRIGVVQPPTSHQLMLEYLGAMTGWEQSVQPWDYKQQSSVGIINTHRHQSSPIITNHQQSSHVITSHCLGHEPFTTSTDDCARGFGSWAEEVHSSTGGAGDLQGGAEGSLWRG